MDVQTKELIAAAALCYYCAGDYDALWETREESGWSEQELEDVLTKYDELIRTLSESAEDILTHYIEPALRWVIDRDVVEKVAAALGYKLRSDVDLGEVMDAIEGHPNMEQVAYLLDDAVAQVLRMYSDEWLEKL